MSEPTTPAQQPIVLPPGSGPGGRPQNVRPTQAERHRPYGDTFGSILLLVLAFGAFLIGMILTTFGYLFADICSARTCNSAAGVTAQSITTVTLALVLLLGAGISILLMVLKRRAIWVAIVTLGLIVVGWVAGAVAFFIALGT